MFDYNYNIWNQNCSLNSLKVLKNLRLVIVEETRKEASSNNGQTLNLLLRKLPNYCFLSLLYLRKVNDSRRRYSIKFPHCYLTKYHQSSTSDQRLNKNDIKVKAELYLPFAWWFWVLLMFLQHFSSFTGYR